MKISKQEFTGLLDRYLSGSASPEETKLLDQFFDLYHNKPEEVTEVSEEVKEEMLMRIQQRLETTGKKHRELHFPLWLRAAAAISFLAIASYFLFSQYLLSTETNEQPLARIKEVRTTKGQKLDIRLPDGSRVKLNSNSKISYPEKLAGDTREVTLEGEAYFDVSSNPSRPFIVHTPYANTHVVGTSFNIHVTPESTEVTLVEGKVDVSIPAGYTTSLLPNEQALISKDDQHITTHQVDVEKYIAWKHNTLQFDETSVREAFGVLENWYNVEIEVNNPALLDCVITSKYKNESLENVLNSFRFMLKMDFNINGNHVTVSGKGCR